MSAPGNSILIFVLLALFVACCGYVAGRIHQRRQEGRHYEAAYRDGYDTATRSAFSLAGRVIGPKRPGGRGSARAAAAAVGVPPVQGSAAASSSTRAGSESPVPKPGAKLSVRHDRVTTEPEQLGFQAPPPPPANTVVTPAAVGGLIYQPFPDPRPSLDGQTPAVPSWGLEGEGRAPRQRSSDAEPSADDAEADPAVVADRTSARREDGSDGREANRGAMARRGVGRRRAEPRATEEDEAAAAVAQGDADESSSGRHTVPDELVQAATYRLPADRVFRARVPDSDTPPDEPARHVPKPRQS